MAARSARWAPPATAVVGADGGEVLALQLYQLQLSILNDDGCASEAQALPGELAPVICAQYQSAIDALDAGDQLVVRLDGVEVQSLSKATANGNFFTPDVVLDIDTFFDANGIAFENGGTHQLTVERSRPLTGERAVYCPSTSSAPPTPRCSPSS